MSEPRMLAIIPAYNEAESIGDVIRNIRKYSRADIVVVNDGSKDATAQIAQDEGVRVINLPFNLGIGGAMQTGYLFALEHGYDLAFQIDGDGQHDPQFMDKLAASVLAGQFDMAIGSRYVEKSGYRSPLSRRAGMLFFSGLISLLTGQTIKDTTSGFRAVNREIIAYFAQNYPTDYPEVDVLVRLYKKGFKVTEIPVRMLERQGGRSSITPWKSFYYMVKVSLALIVSSLRSGGVS